MPIFVQTYNGDPPLGTPSCIPTDEDPRPKSSTPICDATPNGDSPSRPPGRRSRYPFGAQKLLTAFIADAQSYPASRLVVRPLPRQASATAVLCRGMLPCWCVPCWCCDLTAAGPCRWEATWRGTQCPGSARRICSPAAMQHRAPAQMSRQSPARIHLIGLRQPPPSKCQGNRCTGLWC